MTEVIIGRRDEFIALDEFLEFVPAGGRALLFEGDAGIGKTALWHEGLRLARERGYRVLPARAADSESATTFATIGDLFSPVLEETLPRLVPVQRRAVETAFLIRQADGPPPEARLLGTALLSVLHLAAEEEPVVLGFDDAQWVDPSSAEILRFVLRRVESEPIGVLATVRGRPAGAPLELDRAFDQFRRFPVAPLSVGAIHRLLWTRLALTLSRPMLMRVHETAGGNPFFALELGHALADGTIRVDGDEVSLPDSLRAVVARRLGALPKRVRETLVAVAALAAPSVTLLEPLAGTTVEDIELARQRHVLEFEGDRIRFSHPLLGPACYEAMPLHRRRALHRLLADLDIEPEERARHLAVAATGPDEEIAAELDAAALRARGRGAVQAAAELSERAVALTPLETVEVAIRRSVTAAEHCLYAGDARKATAMLEFAVTASEPGPLRAEALALLAEIAVPTGVRAAESHYLQALAQPGLAIRQKVNVLCALAWLANLRGDGRSGSRYANEGLAVAEELGDPDMLALSLSTVAANSFARTGRIREDLLARAIELERAAGGERPLDKGPRVQLSFELGQADRYDEARAICKELIVEATQRADPALSGCLFQLALTELASGAWDEAARLCHEAAELGRQTGLEELELFSLRVLIEIDAHRGNTESARAAIPSVLRAAEQGGYEVLVHRLRGILALLDLSAGDPGGSWLHVAPLFADCEQLSASLAWVAGSVAIEVLIAGGDLSTAERLLALLDDHAAEADTSVWRLAARCRGVLRASHGDHEGAVAALEAAAEDPEPPQGLNPFELARALLALGIVQRKAQHKSGARESLTRSVELFEQLGARLWLEQARSELRRIGGRVPSAGELSETERRIVELVAAGRKNREVAAELSLSPNTVAWNLSKVYRKLGVSSRTELAAYITTTPLV